LLALGALRGGRDVVGGYGPVVVLSSLIAHVWHPARLKENFLLLTNVRNM
jgi:hypothetical protein